MMAKINHTCRQIYGGIFLFQNFRSSLSVSKHSPVIASLAKKYHTMRFEYSFYEIMSGFQGTEIYENGELTSYDYEEIELSEVIE